MNSAPIQDSAESPEARACCKPKLLAFTAPDRGSRRRRLWELDSAAHCPVLGVCLPIAVLRRLVAQGAAGAGLQTTTTGCTASRCRNASTAPRCPRPCTRSWNGALPWRCGRLPPRAARAALAAVVAPGARRRAHAGALWATLTPCALRHRAGAPGAGRRAHAAAPARHGAARGPGALRALLDRERRAARRAGRAAPAMPSKGRRAGVAASSGRRPQACGCALRPSAATPRWRRCAMSCRRCEAQVPGLKRPRRTGAPGAGPGRAHRRPGAALMRARQEADRARRRADERRRDPAHAACPQRRQPHRRWPRPLPRLDDRAVLCVGGRPASVPLYRHIVERSGGRFLHHDGGDEQVPAPRRHAVGGRPGDLPDRLHQPRRLLARQGPLQAPRQALRLRRQPGQRQPEARAGGAAVMSTIRQLLSLRSSARSAASAASTRSRTARARCLLLGPAMRLQFEDETSVRHQIQEVLLAERIADPHRCSTPSTAMRICCRDGRQWMATLFIELPDAAQRERELAVLSLGAHHLYLGCGDLPRVVAAANEDLARSPPGPAERSALPALCAARPIACGAARRPSGSAGLRASGLCLAARDSPAPCADCAGLLLHGAAQPGATTRSQAQRR